MASLVAQVARVSEKVEYLVYVSNWFRKHKKYNAADITCLSGVLFSFFNWAISKVPRGVSKQYLVKHALLY